MTDERGEGAGSDQPKRDAEAGTQVGPDRPGGAQQPPVQRPTGPFPTASSPRSSSGSRRQPLPAFPPASQSRTYLPLLPSPGEPRAGRVSSDPVPAAAHARTAPSTPRAQRVSPHKPPLREQLWPGQVPGRQLVVDAALLLLALVVVVLAAAALSR